MLKTEICFILYNKVYPCHDSGTKVGILCRKLIKKYFKICKSDPMFDGKLPVVTDVDKSDDDKDNE